MEDKDIEVILERIDKLNKSTVDIYYTELKHRLDDIHARLRRLEYSADDSIVRTKDIGLLVSQIKDQVDFISEVARQ